MIQRQGKVLLFKGQYYKETISCAGVEELICEFGSANGMLGNLEQFLKVFKDINEVQILSINLWQQNLKIIDPAILSIEYIRNCQIYNFGSFLSQFLNMFPSLTNLKISVWQCSLGDEGLEQVASYLKDLKSLKQLFIDFRWNQVKDKGFTSLSSVLGQLNQLQSLQIEASNNLITHKSMEHFGQQIAKLEELKNFDLIFESNEMQSVGIKYLSEGIKKCSKLTDISLNFKNNIIKDNETLRKACQALSQCSQLVNSKFDFLMKRRRYYYGNDKSVKGKEGLYKNELFKLQRTVLLEIDNTEQN